MLKVYTFRIDIIKNNISVEFVTCSENGNFINFIYTFEHLFSVRSDIEPSLENAAGLHLDVQGDIRRTTGVFSPHTMGQGLVKIED